LPRRVGNRVSDSFVTGRVSKSEHPVTLLIQPDLCTLFQCSGVRSFMQESSMND